MKNFCPIYLASQQHSSNLAFIGCGRRLTFFQANALVGGLAHRLSGMGLGRRVSILSKNNLEMILLVFAMQRLGVSVVLHNTRLKPKDWKTQAELAGVRCGFVSQEFLESAPFKNVLPLPELDSSKEFSAELDYENEAVVIFTSGSTGTGKGVRLSLRNLISNANASNEVNNLSKGDTWLASLPFFHVGGLCIVFRTILAGACSLISDSQNASEIFSQLSNISHVSLVPSVLAEIIELENGELKLARLKNILLGGAPSDVKLLEKVSKLPVRTSYGMTETSSHISMLERPNTLQIEDLKTSGKLLAEVDLKISEEGEVCLRGPSIFIGYLGQKERNPLDWFDTGDLGTLDNEGRLIVKGRKDRIIISGGENINPKQIEDLALEFSEIKEAVVVGVSDSKWGARPYLFIVTENNFSKEKLENILKQKLPKYKIPDKIINLSSIPKTAIGKIDYQQLVESAKSL